MMIEIWRDLLRGRFPSHEIHQSRSCLMETTMAGFLEEKKQGRNLLFLFYCSFFFFSFLQSYKVNGLAIYFFWPWKKYIGRRGQKGAWCLQRGHNDNIKKERPFLLFLISLNVVDSRFYHSVEIDPKCPLVANWLLGTGKIGKILAFVTKPISNHLKSYKQRPSDRYFWPTLTLFSTIFTDWKRCYWVSCWSDELVDVMENGDHPPLTRNQKEIKKEKRLVLHQEKKVEQFHEQINARTFPLQDNTFTLAWCWTSFVEKETGRFEFLYWWTSLLPLWFSSSYHCPLLTEISFSLLTLKAWLLLLHSLVHQDLHS